MKRSLHVYCKYAVIRMIGFFSSPSGRMGNVLIQYIFLRQLAERIGTEFFHIRLPYSQYFEGFGRRNLSLKFLLSKKKWWVDLNAIESVGVDAFIKEAKDKNKKGYIIILKPPMLGHLFEFKEENPARFLKIKDKYWCGIENRENKTLVGLHFRGSDFKGWNDRAVLSTEYYRNAINAVLKRLAGDSEKVRWLLFTDDNEFLAYCETLKYLQSIGFDFVAGNADNPMMEDFCRLSQCDYIISSPSTFAIMAAIIGKENKKIIHNKEWVLYCVQKGESFWEDIMENCVPWYQVIELL